LPYQSNSSSDPRPVGDRSADFKEGKRRTAASFHTSEISVSAIHQSGPARVPDAWDSPPLVSRLDDFAPRRQVLENGLTLVYEQRPGVGLIALELYSDSGSVRESKPGAAYLAGRLREEGTVARSARELAQAIEDAGGSFETRSTGCSFRARAEDLAMAFEILADLTLRPAFPEEATSWVLERIGSELKADLDDPAFLADLAFHSSIYGDHPLGRDPRGSVRDIEKLNRTDALSHHERHVNPESSILVAVGDFEPRRLLTLVKKWFSAWPRRGKAAEPLPRVPKRGGPQVRRIERRGEQVQIELGHLGITRHHPDFDRLVVLDHILGSGPGFTDRLGKTLREELGLVYSVSGGMTDSADLLPGVFRIAAATSPDATERVVATIIQIVKDVSVGRFSDEDVLAARRYLAGSWVFDFQGIEQRAERLLELERWGLSLDEPFHWPDRIDSITSEEVRRAARRHLRPNGLTRVELGPSRPRGKRSRIDTG
jgi:zinc protease